MSKFVKGEIAIFVTNGKAHKGILGGGSECELIRLATHADLDARQAFTQGNGAPVWYCKFPGDPGPSNGLWSVPENFLRKRRPPEQPADDQEFIDWCNTLGRDTETTMRNVARNLQRFMESRNGS